MNEQLLAKVHDNTLHEKVFVHNMGYYPHAKATENYDVNVYRVQK